MSVQQVTQIAANNAAWCDLICRLHGRPGEFRNDLWLNLRAVPPFYPNAVTLAEDEASIQAAIGTLATRLQTSTWAVKDSFGRLNLSSFGMKRLFDADWIARPATLDVLASQQPDVHWRRVETSGELNQWERVWRQAGHVQEDAAWPRIFPTTLLVRKEVAVLAAYRGYRMVAGAMANFAAGYVGLTNIFTAEPDPAGVLGPGVQLASKLFPGSPLAGYESGKRLQVMKALGFEPIGPLAAWVKSTDGD